jgi:hypothetical protein
MEVRRTSMQPKGEPMPIAQSDAEIDVAEAAAGYHPPTLALDPVQRTRT